jgi:hypothetical protein
VTIFGIRLMGMRVRTGRRGRPWFRKSVNSKTGEVDDRQHPGEQVCAASPTGDRSLTFSRRSPHTDYASPVAVNKSKRCCPNKIAPKVRAHKKAVPGHARNGFSHARSIGVRNNLPDNTSVHGALTAGAATFVFLQVTLTQTDGLRRDFDQFVVVDKFNRVFQRHLDRRH